MDTALKMTETGAEVKDPEEYEKTTSMNIFRTIRGFGRQLKNTAADFWRDETGAGVVEMILIIVVLIGLVLIFKSQLTEIVNSIFDTIRSKAGQV